MAVPTKPLVILGPTASGKSDLALALARRVGGDILSVDSMQVYRGMDIGTAKPNALDQAQIKHHLIDLVEPGDEFTVARFVELADSVLLARIKPIVATGGTPLYYKSLFEGIFNGPGADDAIREKLRQRSNADLYAQLQQVDPLAAQRIHVNDARRLIRALEVYELTRKPISSFQTDWIAAKPRHDAVWIGLSWEKEALNRRINARVKAMMSAGWLDEVKRLPPLSKTAAEATGYRELLDHLAGKIDLAEAIEQIKIATRQLARRQMKWLRRFPGVTWLPGDAAVQTLVDQALTLWARS